MAIKNNWIEVDAACITVADFTPTTAVATTATTFNFTVTPSAGTVSSVNISWGDGTTTAATAGTAPAYSGDHTYTTAGTYLVKVITTLSGGETSEEWYQVIVTA